MYISRIRVDGGFLDGLDLRLADGLNVLIGARGTGKTSILELLRYCLGIATLTEQASARSETQAISVLAGGAVTVDLQQDDKSWTVRRSSQGAWEAGEAVPWIGTVLAQNEMEVVGALPSGRLALIDRFTPARTDELNRMRLAQAEVRSLTSEVQSTLIAVLRLREQLTDGLSLTEQLEVLRVEQARSMADMNASQAERSLLTSLQEQTRYLASRSVDLQNLQSLLADHVSAVETWPNRWFESLFTPELSATDTTREMQLRRRLQEAASSVHAAAVLIRSAHADAAELLQETDDVRQTIDIQSRHLQARLESLQVGFSSLMRRVAELEERAGRVEALRREEVRHSESLAEVRAQRERAWLALESSREGRFWRRAHVAERLNRALGPSVRVRVAKSQMTAQYEAALANALRGSRLHYNSLAPLVASTLTPLELVDAVETGETSALCSLGLTEERARNITFALREADLSSIIGTEIDDGVVLELLDGVDYKPAEQLSIGQRCTAVLPLVLSGPGVLMIDQPEDHLDNRFIVNTLAVSLQRRGAGAQCIVSSHNANIPVLGNAAKVVSLASDGRRGYVAHAGDLQDHATVEAITTVMEGGEEAFRRRALFYGLA